MINVVEAISDTNIGGAGILLLNRLNNTDRTIFHTTVLLPKGSKLIQRLANMNIDVCTVNGGKDSSFDLTSLYQYYKAIKKAAPHILNSHGSLNSRIAGMMCQVPIRIYTRHCVYPTERIYDIPAVKYICNKLTEMLSHRIIAVAYAAKDNLVKIGIDKSKICVIVNGAEPLRKMNGEAKKKIKAKLGIDEDKTVVTICARLEACKDHRCFLKAASELCKKSDKYRFLIIGEGSQKHNLKCLCHSLKLDDKVVFTGFVKDVSPFMGITDINVNCSVGTETSSLALSEGMSIGVPAVVSDYGGNPYMIKHGINGYVYRAGDYKKLAYYIIKAKNNHERLSAEALKRYNTELNARSMTQKTQKLYLQLYKNKIKGVNYEKCNSIFGRG